MSSRRRRRSRHVNRRRWLLGLGAALVLGIGVVTWRVIRAPDAAEFFAAAEQARKAQEYSAAIINYKNTLLANPDNLEARWRLGETYLALKQIPEALSELESARPLGNDVPAVWLALAQAQLEAGKFTESLRSLDRYTGPAQSEAQALRARANLGLGEAKAAREVLTAATARDPQAQSLHLATARLALSERDLAGAEVALKKALEIAPEEPESLRLMARVQLLQGRAKEAIDTYRQATRHQPNDTDGLAGLAEALLTDRQLDAAGEVVAQLAKQAPGSTGAEFLKGWLAYARDEWAGAEASLLNVVKVAPKHPQALLMLGDSCFRLEKYNQAESYLKAFDDAYPNQPPARKLLAAVYLKQKRAGEAIKLLMPLASDDTTDVGVLSLLSYAHFAAGDTATGKSFLARAQHLAPESRLLQTQQALGEIAAGNESAGVGDLEKLAEGPDGQVSRQALTYFHLLKGNGESALQSAQALRDLNPKDPMAHNLLGIALARQGDLAGAKTAFEQALALDAKFAPGLANLGLLALDGKREEEGEALLRKALAADRTYTAASLALAALADRRGELAAATRLLEDAMAAQPQAAQPKWLLAERKVRAGDPEGALKLAREAHALAPKSPQSRLLLGSLQLLAGRGADAVGELNSLLAEKPDFVPAAAALGDAARATGQWDLARTSYRKVLAADPLNRNGLWGLFATEIGAKDYLAAEALLEEMKRLPDPLEAENARGELAAAQGRHGEAIAVFEGVHRRSQTTRSLMRLADALQQKGDADKLNRTLSAWLLEKPQDTAVRLRLGTLELVSGRTREAQATFETALEHAPDNAVALNNLAWLYDQADDERALGLAERAYKALPNSAETADTLAWIMVKQQNAQKALPLLEKAHQLMPAEPNIRFHLAYALAELGNRDKARGMLETLLEKENRFESMNDARALLRRLAKAEHGDAAPDAGLRF